MKVAVAELESVSAYSQSRFHNLPKKDKESPDDYEKRTWRDKSHFDEHDNLYIPPMAFKGCIEEAAKFLSIKVGGKGQATWTKNFKAGILVVDPLKLPVKKDAVAGEWIHCNADGVRGSGKRVMRCFPVVPAWKGEVTFHIIDNQITEDIFRKHLDEAGMLIGIGRFRPRNGGFCGRFKVKNVKWQDAA